MTEAMIGDFLKPADKRRHAVDLLVDPIFMLSKSKTESEGI